jgi:hypothetical protein
MADGVYPRTLRFRIIAQTPTVFIDYLLELWLAFMGIVVGVAYFTGFITPNSVIRLLPELVGRIYSLAMLLGSLAVAVGLLFRRYGTVVPSGLSLISVACLAYTISVVYYLGFRIALSVILMGAGFTALAAWRSFILRSTFILFSSKRQGSQGEGPTK